MIKIPMSPISGCMWRGTGLVQKRIGMVLVWCYFSQVCYVCCACPVGVWTAMWSHMDPHKWSQWRKCGPKNLHLWRWTV